MRNLILKDKSIPQDEYEKLIDDIRTFYAEKFPTQKSLLDYYTEEKNFTDLEFSEYHTGLGIDKSRIETELKEISKRDGGKYDNIVYLVHENNWKPKRIWGWNIAYAYYGYEVQQVRWDKDNLVNTFGTLNHEHSHSFDSYPYRKLGINVERKLGIKDLDGEWVHGGGDYDYIGSKTGKENKEWLSKIEPYLEKAWTIGRLQYEFEQNPDNTELLQDIAEIIKQLRSSVVANITTSSETAMKTVEELRNVKYAMTHKDIPLKVVKSN